MAVDVPRDLEGPLPTNAVVGHATVRVGERTVGTVDVVTGAKVPAVAVPTRVLRAIGGPATLVVIAVIGALALVLLAPGPDAAPAPRRPPGRSRDRMIITVTLNAAVDRTLVVPNFRLGRRHRTVDQTTLPGGKGVNVARAIKRLGQPVIATGFAGGATGTRVVEALTDESILNDFVRIRDESRTNTAVLDPTTGCRPRSTSAAPRSPLPSSSSSATSSSTSPRARHLHLLGLAARAASRPRSMRGWSARCASSA